MVRDLTIKELKELLDIVQTHNCDLDSLPKNIANMYPRLEKRLKEIIDGRNK